MPSPLSSIDDACDFVRYWLHLDRDYPGPRLPDGNLPEPFHRLNARFGQVWMDLDHPIRAIMHPGCPPNTLFDCQDEIHAPHRLEPDTYGVRCFWSECQGVSAFGLHEDQGLMVGGDWHDRNGAEPWPDWRPVDLDVESVLVFGLLRNLLNLTVDLSFCDRSEDDPALDCILFDGSRFWPGWPGMLTDAHRIIIADGPEGMVSHRPGEWPSELSLTGQ